MLIAVVAYILIGLAGGLAASAASPRQVVVWRLAAWVLSLLTFLGHIAFLRLRRSGRLVSAATQAAMSVAIAAWVLALAGPVRSHWGQSGIGRVVALSVILWPVLTGIPAFGFAYMIGSVIDRASRKATGGETVN
jgi:multisubunit Na+/H+ antiporter MnhF subunit